MSKQQNTYQNDDQVICLGYIEKGTGKHQSNMVYSIEGVAPCLTHSDEKQPYKIIENINSLKIINATSKGYLNAFEGDGIDLGYPDSNTRRGRVQPQMAHTIQCNAQEGVVIKMASEPVNPMPDGLCRPLKAQYYKTSKANFKYTSTYGATGVMNNLRIRKLTPRECWRLMDFDDEDIDKCVEAGISNTQLYKQAGNSIVVAVLEAVLKNLLSEEDTP